LRRVVFALALAGCYDVDALSHDFDAGTTPAGDGGALDLAAVGGWSPVPTGTRAALRGVWAAAPGEAFIVGGGSTVLHAHGDALSIDAMAPGYNLRSIAGVGAPVAGGDSGALLERQSDGWHDVGLGDATWFALWSGASGDFWAAGSGASILHMTPAGAKGVDTSDTKVTGALYGIAGRGSEVWAAGEGGALIHVANDVAMAGVSGTSATLRAAFADANRIVLVGDGGLVLSSSDGTSFTPVPSGTTVDLFAVFGTADGLWAAGDGGTIVRIDTRGGTVERAGGAALRALGGTGAGDLWAAGDDGALFHRHM